MSFMNINIYNCYISSYIHAKSSIIGNIGGLIGNAMNMKVNIENVTNSLEGAFYNSTTYGGIIGAGHDNAYGNTIYTQAKINLKLGSHRFINAYGGDTTNYTESKE